MNGTGGERQKFELDHFSLSFWIIIWWHNNYKTIQICREFIKFDEIIHLPFFIKSNNSYGFCHLQILGPFYEQKDIFSFTKKKKWFLKIIIIDVPSVRWGFSNATLFLLAWAELFKNGLRSWSQIKMQQSLFIFRKNQDAVIKWPVCIFCRRKKLKIFVIGK